MIGENVMKFSKKKKAIAVVVAAATMTCSIGSFAACSSNDAITIGIYNTAGWSNIEATEIMNYIEYLNKYIVDDEGDPIFNFVYPATTNLADEVNSFIAQGVDGIMLLNSWPTAAVEAACAADGIPYFSITGSVNASHVGSNPSEYCLGGVNAYGGDTREVGRMWLDLILDDMEESGAETATCWGIMFPQSMSADHDEIIDGMRYYIENEPGTYGGISIGSIYYSTNVPLSDYVPSILTTVESEISNSDSDANYILGFANGMGMIVPTLSSKYYDQSSGLYGVKMLAIGYTPDSKDALSEYVLSELTSGIAGFVIGLVRIYNFLQGVEYTDVDDYADEDGIINISTAWYVITEENYDNFVEYVWGGGDLDFNNYTPPITAENVLSLLGCTSLAEIEAYSNRTLDEVVAANSNS